MALDLAPAALLELGQNVGKSDLGALRAPCEVGTPLEEQLGEGIEERLPRVLLNEEELAHLVDLEKDGAPLWSDDEVETAEDQAEPLEERDRTRGEIRVNGAGLHAQLGVGSSPVEPAVLGLLGEHASAQDMPPHDREAQLPGLGDQGLEDAGRGPQELVLDRPDRCQAKRDLGAGPYRGSGSLRGRFVPLTQRAWTRAQPGSWRLWASSAEPSGGTYLSRSPGAPPQASQGSFKKWLGASWALACGRLLIMIPPRKSPAPLPVSPSSPARHWQAKTAPILKPPVPSFRSNAVQRAAVAAAAGAAAPAVAAPPPAAPAPAVAAPAPAVAAPAPRYTVAQAKTEAGNAVRAWARTQRARRGNTGDLVGGMCAVAIDRQSGRRVQARAGDPPKLANRHATLAAHVTNWNCAEVKAANSLLNGGSNAQDLVFAAMKPRLREDGTQNRAVDVNTLRKPCGDCAKWIRAIHANAWGL